MMNFFLISILTYDEAATASDPDVHFLKAMQKLCG